MKTQDCFHTDMKHFHGPCTLGLIRDHQSNPQYTHAERVLSIDWKAFCISKSLLVSVQETGVRIFVNEDQVSLQQHNYTCV